MKIPCIRCGKVLETPNATNADYVVANDFIVTEDCWVLLALKHNQSTLDKEKAKLPIEDSEYESVEISSLQDAAAIGEDLVKLIAAVKPKQVQKTGIICPVCYRPTDMVIWGVHKTT